MAAVAMTMTAGSPKRRKQQISKSKASKSTLFRQVMANYSNNELQYLVIREYCYTNLDSLRHDDKMAVNII